MRRKQLMTGAVPVLIALAIAWNAHAQFPGLQQVIPVPPPIPPPPIFVPPGAPHPQIPGGPPVVVVPGPIPAGCVLLNCLNKTPVQALSPSQVAQQFTPVLGAISLFEIALKTGQTDSFMSGFGEASLATDQPYSWFWTLDPRLNLPGPIYNGPTIGPNYCGNSCQPLPYRPLYYDEDHPPGTNLDDLPNDDDYRHMDEQFKPQLDTEPLLINYIANNLNSDEGDDDEDDQ